MPTRLLLLIVLSCATCAFAQSWPARPVRFILPNSAGSGPDVVARLAADNLERILKQPFIVDNRPGGNFFIAAEAIARANPDGYTIGMGSATMSSRFLPAATFAPTPPMAPRHPDKSSRLPAAEAQHQTQSNRPSPQLLSAGTGPELQTSGLR